LIIFLTSKILSEYKKLQKPLPAAMSAVRLHNCQLLNYSKLGTVVIEKLFCVFKNWFYGWCI